MKLIYTLFLTLAFLFILSVEGFSQSAATKNQTYNFVETMPAYKEGNEAMYKYLSSSIPYSKDKPEGKVVVSFVVDKDGSIMEVKLLKGLDSVLDEACMQAIRGMSGNWNPGMQKGKPVSVRFTIPLDFKH